VYQSSVSLQSCTFVSNAASSLFAGAVGVLLGDSFGFSFDAIDCKFTSNSAVLGGGALGINFAGMSNATVIRIVKCQFLRDSTLFSSASLRLSPQGSMAYFSLAIVDSSFDEEISQSGPGALDLMVKADLREASIRLERCNFTLVRSSAFYVSVGAFSLRTLELCSVVIRDCQFLNTFAAGVSVHGLRFNVLSIDPNHMNTITAYGNEYGEPIGTQFLWASGLNFTCMLPALWNDTLQLCKGQKRCFLVIILTPFRSIKTDINELLNCFNIDIFIFAIVYDAGEE
jgi:hypothetical protein